MINYLIKIEITKMNSIILKIKFEELIVILNQLNTY